MAQDVQMAPLEEKVRKNPFAKVGDEEEIGVEELLAAYVPSPEDEAAVDEVDRKFEDWRRVRSEYEPQWYVNAAFFRGYHDLRWSGIDQRLISTPSVMPQRQTRKINRIFAKLRARRAKFTKNRPTWVIVPATSDSKDKMNARLTGKVLDYVWRKLRLEQKFDDALAWAEVASRGYWWFGWDENVIGRISIVDPLTGEKTIQEGMIGDVTVEVGSPFEVVVADPSKASLSQQPEIIRAKERTLDYIRGRYPERGHLVQAEGSGQTFQFERQIANISPQGGGTSSTISNQRDAAGNPTTVVVKEFFCRPSPSYPKGRYYVVAGGILLKSQDELPYGLWDMENPFPCVEFIDVRSAGQYWGTTVCEQLIDLQREYNGIRSMISTQIKLMGHPKVFVAKQHQIPEGAWTPDAGEIIEYIARPNIKEPYVWMPPNIIGDAWNAIELLRTEFEDVSQIYPAAEGSTRGTESGFHANLLQEAADLVHGPDIRSHELSVEEAAFKLRRIVKKGYTVPRLITATSSSYQPEVFEFSADEVDDYADIVVQAGSALPMLKGARIQAALDLYAKGLLGDPADPEVRRRVLNVLDLGGMEDVYEYARIDEDMINLENSSAEDGETLAEPRFFEDHQKHWTGHVNKLKSPAVLHWTPEARMGLLAHAILHAKYVNHAAAFQMSIEAGLVGLIPPPMEMFGPAMPPAPPGMEAEGSPPASGGPPGAPEAAPDASFNEAKDMTPASGTEAQ